ncbi:Flp pilus assembly protein CpaB [Marinobacter sediminum]|uniref:Flp pilus assembly protein CpaB n=1 Tax=Marinobacter sediminum TaxID=256323 RepID=UPI00202E14CC|nr:Flp pilus assembly protein CpaB [Marinobacter sediminum]MCM0612001.1 Flp pilus assembly protein CpaB [Marinobacter sediminum]
MQIRALIVLAVSLILGGVTVYLANTYLQQEVGVRSEGEVVKTVPVVVAASNLKITTRLDRLMLQVVQWPEESVPENAYQSIDVVMGDKPPVVLRETRRGEPLLPYKLSPHGARGGLPARIPEDMRAITMPVNEIRGVAGFVSPGDYVDVLHTTNLGRRDERPVTRMLIQNARVLGVDQESSESETDPNVANAVTLLVTPFDGQRVNLAIATGEVGLMLRNEFDASLIEEQVASYEHLLTIEKNRKTKIYKRERRPSVEVIRGLDIRKQEVKEGEPLDQQSDAAR